jgi:hypothetical protein
VSILQGHRDRFDLALAEIFEGEQLDRLILLAPFIHVAAPAVRTQLPGPQDKSIGAYHFHPFHDGYLQTRNYSAYEAEQYEKNSTKASIRLMLRAEKRLIREGFQD